MFLITGIGSGIGKALFENISRKKYLVIGTARGETFKALNEKYAESTIEAVLELDLNLSDHIDKVVSVVRDKWGIVDILINNAGVSYRSVIEHMSEDEELLQFKTNYFGPVTLIKKLIPEMRQKGSGRIINISSVGGMMSMPTMGSYSASKFALEGISEALWYELKPWNIQVSLIQPGFIHSNSFKKVYISKKGEEAIKTNGDYKNYYTLHEYLYRNIYE